ncbi:rhodanese family protein [Pseudoxanthomonas sp.]|jgi:rhodanese-related sulfurtransferase|uniref:rhodanese family protein n=1 Tax=Pseudoxanthomonas sp. TaxID=1871049 RepID=UPI002E1378FA|nr:rhodanese family protein [Pseudoxanthomonas sp.]
MTIPSISPEQAQALLADGALLVDIRNHDEHAREHIPGAMLWPVSQPTASLSTGSAKTVIFHCRSGVRTQANAATLAAAAGCEAFLMSGGLDAWKRAGLPVRQDRRQPIELMRQVQIAAGSLVLAGVLVAATLSPYGLLLSGFVGAGLVFAGVSGFCGMARLLAAMPWNRRAMP